MNDIGQKIRETARQLLQEGQVDCVIGYEASPRGGVRPAFIYDAGEAERLVWSTRAVHNLATYLHDKKKPARRGEAPPRVAVVVKPCDSRTINVLLAEGQIERERTTVIGVTCDGMVDESGAPLPRCVHCAERTPVVYDVLIGSPPDVDVAADDDADLAHVEALPPTERLAFWLHEFDRCIRCYACRQVCPGCYCTTCMFERDDGLWVDAGVEMPGKYIFHLGRALHLAGRCVGCDECERVCPMGLPLRLLNRRLAREVETLYGYRAGREETLAPLLFELGEEGSPI
ncbi:MAG: 4Fe-4S dicluster domain-containing protein [Anaerolineae bacterium]|nr:4Fe-4S dicluster domain-containing protein [Anaerolineae bacterium]